MLKSVAISHLGGTPAAAARAIGITDQAVKDWPDVLPRRIADRVIAALARQGKKIPQELLSTAAPTTSTTEEGVQ
ncbi:Cro/CI family transcriptional regulator [uncultured Pseudacidovorax sp.]|uniref:Cro/CI family transcriptional regulator n=1 Tax=uncultured Pseudacidovorax sp. TaxID=679313 RepID=UPI0025E87701|nr:Cro/CI family transcriptional regulator [uncultured Pseudacidovorax sp.]